MKVSAVRAIPIGATVTFKEGKQIRKGILTARGGRGINAHVHVPRVGYYSVDDADFVDVLHLPRI